MHRKTTPGGHHFRNSGPEVEQWPKMQNSLFMQQTGIPTGKPTPRWKDRRHCENVCETDLGKSPRQPPTEVPKVADFLENNVVLGAERPEKSSPQMQKKLEISAADCPETRRRSLCRKRGVFWRSKARKTRSSPMAESAFGSRRAAFWGRKGDFGGGRGVLGAEGGFWGRKGRVLGAEGAGFGGGRGGFWGRKGWPDLLHQIRQSSPLGGGGGWVGVARRAWGGFGRVFGAFSFSASWRVGGAWFSFRRRNEKGGPGRRREALKEKSRKCTGKPPQGVTIFGILGQRWSSGRKCKLPYSCNKLVCPRGNRPLVGKIGDIARMYVRQNWESRHGSRRLRSRKSRIFGK